MNELARGIHFLHNIGILIPFYTIFEAAHGNYAARKTFNDHYQ